MSRIHSGTRMLSLQKGAGQRESRKAGQSPKAGRHTGPYSSYGGTPGLKDSSIWERPDVRHFSLFHPQSDRPEMPGCHRGASQGKRLYDSCPRMIDKHGHQRQQLQSIFGKPPIFIPEISHYGLCTALLFPIIILSVHSICIICRCYRFRRQKITGPAAPFLVIPA